LAFGALRDADTKHRSEGIVFLDSQSARGGTQLRLALATAYKYATGDRPLNVVVLSDGLTEQQDRPVLLDLIRTRPSNTRVFCIGIGNDVNRPLLEQLAEDAGGLAAFVSHGDDFARQATLFRRKLMRPVAAAVDLKIVGVEVEELEPATIPDLYAGSPVRLYGRYRGQGTAQVTLRASINGVEVRDTAAMDFPAIDPANPEIDRLWATHRIDSLVKQADRTGNRGAVQDKIVALGEAFSVVTEYTSFIVLENDSEYQRWKIERRNQDRLRGDRQALETRRLQIDALRTKAIADIGPQPASAPALAARQPQDLAPARPGSAPAVAPADSTPRRSLDLDLGTGPVGPLSLALVLWFLRRKRQTA
jgi:Ca-activated chloride channel family protein